MPPRQTEVSVREKTQVAHRVSVGLIAISLSLMSLALGLTLLSMPLPASVFLAVPVIQQSTPSTATAATLTWTAPGDDGNVGQATSYDLRYSSSPLTADNFSLATSVTGVPAPQPAGSTETYTVTGLQPATTYFFGLKTSDEAGNVSTLSNIASYTTATSIVACVPTYSCSDWSSCLNGHQTRTCTVTNGCPAGLDQPVTDQSCEAAVGGTPDHLSRHEIVVAAAPGVAPVFRLVNPATLKVEREVLAFNKNDLHGLNVAIGDLSGDHQPDIIAGSGAGTVPSVKMFSASGAVVATFSPYPVNSKNGVAVAVGDVNGDGKDELITIPAKGPPQLRVFTYNPANKRFTQLAQTFVFDRNLTNGFSVAAGDLTLDGRAEIVVAPRTNGTSVAVLNLKGSTLRKISQFRPYPTTFRSGLTLAVGDTDGNGRNEIITAPGPGYYSNVKVFDQRGRQLVSFLPTSRSYLGGLTLSTLDINQDGRDELLTGTYQKGDPGIRVYRYSGLTHKFEHQSSATVYAKSIKVGLRLASQ